MTVLVGIPACAKTIDDLPRHLTPARYAVAVFGGSEALPVLLPPMGDAMVGTLDRLDGLLLPGSPSNVEPHLYGTSVSLTPDRHDPARDATTLPLVRAALARGMPVLAICRGVQELNVALGGTLFQQVQDVPGRMDHRSNDDLPRDEQYRPVHAVALTGQLARIIGRIEIQVNSLHEQALDRLAPGLVVEATAPDGTIEGVRVAEARGFAFGVQWHPEHRWAEDAASVALFRAFGEACRAYSSRIAKAA